MFTHSKIRFISPQNPAFSLRKTLPQEVYYQSPRFSLSGAG